MDAINIKFSSKIMPRCKRENIFTAGISGRFTRQSFLHPGHVDPAVPNIIHNTSDYALKFPFWGVLVEDVVGGQWYPPLI